MKVYTVIFLSIIFGVMLGYAWRMQHETYRKKVYPNIAIDMAHIRNNTPVKVIRPKNIQKKSK